METSPTGRKGIMQVRTSYLAALAAIVTFVLAVTLLVNAGSAEALLLVLVVAALAGMYLLRRYARVHLLYRHLPARKDRHR